jgi:hypothetical protein
MRTKVPTQSGMSRTSSGCNNPWRGRGHRRLHGGTSAPNAAAAPSLDETGRCWASGLAQIHPGSSSAGVPHHGDKSPGHAILLRDPQTHALVGAHQHEQTLRAPSMRGDPAWTTWRGGWVASRAGALGRMTRHSSRRALRDPGRDRTALLFGDRLPGSGQHPAGARVGGFPRVRRATGSGLAFGLGGDSPASVLEEVAGEGFIVDWRLVPTLLVLRGRGRG